MILKLPLTSAAGIFRGAMEKVNLSSPELEKWGQKALGELKGQATEEVSGIAFDAMRLPTGERFIVVLCATKTHDIKNLIVEFQLPESPKIHQDWNRIAYFDLLKLAMSGSGFGALFDFDSHDNATALALICADPDSIKRVESVFDMPS